MLILQGLFLFCLFLCMPNVCLGIPAERIYATADQQFPPDSDQFVMPPTVFFTIYMRRLAHPHLPLLLESMRWNPMVHFKIISIMPEGSDHATYIINLKKNLNISNLFIITLTMEQFSERVKSRLGLNVTYTTEWFYKMCDYKPIIAYLFPEHSGPEYKYWGYGDIDLIWGNFSKYAHWFQGQPYVISGSMMSLQKLF